MNTYIIDPMWIYWINVCDALKGVSIGIAVLAAIALVIAMVCMAENAKYGVEDKDYLSSRKAFLISLPICLFFTMASIFIPSTKTLIEMAVAKLATQENIELSVDALKFVVDYIVETIKSIK